MTITSRGAVAPTGDRAGPGDGAAAAGAPFDAAALECGSSTRSPTTPSRGPRPVRRPGRDLLQQVITDTMAVEDDWLAAACAAKGLTPGTTEAGEELFTGLGTFVRMARLLRDALRDIAKDGKPAFAGPVREAADGRLRVQVFPAGAFDRITFPQTTAEIYMQPGVTRESLVAGQAAAYADPARPRRHRARPGRRQRGLARSARCAVQALRRGQGRRDEGQPGQRLPGAVLARALAALIDAGVLRIVRWWRRGRAAPDRARPHRRGAHHGLGQDVRRRRLRHRSRGRPPQGGGRARAGQAGDGRVGQRLAGDRGAGQVVDGRAALPGRACGDHVGEQRGLQLRLGPRRRHPRRLAPARGLSRCADPDPRRPDHPSGLLPGRGRPACRLHRRPSRRRGVRQRAGRRARPGRSSAASPRARPGTSASTWSPSSGRWPRRL